MIYASCLQTYDLPLFVCDHNYYYVLARFLFSSSTFWPSFTKI